MISNGRAITSRWAPFTLANFFALMILMNATSSIFAGEPGSKSAPKPETRPTFSMNLGFVALGTPA